MANIDEHEDRPDQETYLRLLHSGLGHLAAAVETLAAQAPTGAPQAMSVLRRATRDFDLAMQMLDAQFAKPEMPEPPDPEPEPPPPPEQEPEPPPPPPAETA